jgi:hypothetical protein
MFTAVEDLLGFALVLTSSILPSTYPNCEREPPPLCIQLLLQLAFLYTLPRTSVFLRSVLFALTQLVGKFPSSRPRTLNKLQIM